MDGELVYLVTNDHLTLDNRGGISCNQIFWDWKGILTIQGLSKDMR